jgi:CPA1 family monovalent cation:H+ antiporter
VRSTAETFVGLIVATAVLAEVARRLRIPSAVVLVLGGLALGFVPGVSAPRLDPGVFFFLFLPPLLYSEAFLYSTEDLKAEAAEIVLLAVGLVVATTLAVAAVAHTLAGLPWPAAFVLGAVVGSTDPVAATSVIRRLGVSDRIETILEGEALANDGTALAAYKMAVAAAGASAFSVARIPLDFAWIALGGIAIGALVAWLAGRARRLVTLPEVEIAFSLLMPFVAYLPAERVGVSGVLAAVTAGLIMGGQAHAASGETRLRRDAFWEVLVFLLNSMLFLFIGLTFPDILDQLGGVAAGDLLWDALAVVVCVMGLRLAWMFLVPRVVSVLDQRRPSGPPVGELAVLGWSGMRGGVSLAAALSIPVATAGHAFPGRAQIIFFAYVVVLATIVVPGLTLGTLIDRLGVGSGRDHAAADARARARILQAALEHIEELAETGELPAEIADRLRLLYESRLDGLRPDLAQPAAGNGASDRSPELLIARRGVIGAQREALADLEDMGAIGTRAARTIEHELEVEEALCR